MLPVALVLSEEHTVYSRREAVMDGRSVSAEVGVIMFPAWGARLMGYASVIYNTLISLESEAQLI